MTSLLLISLLKKNVSVSGRFLASNTWFDGLNDDNNSQKKIKPTLFLIFSLFQIKLFVFMVFDIVARFMVLDIIIRFIA